MGQPKMGQDERVRYPLDEERFRLICQRFIAEVRASVKEAPEVAREGGAPCHTCAIQPSTDSWTGFETTMVGFAASLGSDRPFLCHEPLEYALGGWVPPEDIDGAKRCAAMDMARLLPRARRAWVRAMWHPRELGDAEADKLGGAFDWEALGDLVAPFAEPIKCTMPEWGEEE